MIGVVPPKNKGTPLRMIGVVPPKKNNHPTLAGLGFDFCVVLLLSYSAFPSRPNFKKRQL